MTADEVMTLFIEAAVIDRRIPSRAGPAKVKSMDLGFVRGWEEMNQWGEDRYKEERAEFFEAMSSRLNPNEVSTWERASDLIAKVSDQSQRRCLLHWSIAKAGGKPFSIWCRKVEHIHEETGRRRKDRAVLAIVKAISSPYDMHNHEIALQEVLLCEGEIGDKSNNVGQSRAWMAEGARPVITSEFDEDIIAVDWAEIQNKRRREAFARRNKAA